MIQKNIQFQKDITYLTSNKEKSVLIIGASSLIANSFCLELAKSGLKLYLVFREKIKIFINLLNKLDQFNFPYELLQINLQNKSDIKKFFINIDNWSKSNFIQGFIILHLLYKFIFI